MRHRRIAIWIAAAIGAAGLAPPAAAQLDAKHAALDSPVKQSPVYGAGEIIVCSVTLGGAPALFGTDTVDGSAASKLFVQDELFSPFRVFEIDEGCNPVSTYSTAFGSATMTGIAVDNSSTANYWVVDPTAQTLNQFQRGSGAPTGGAVSLPPSAGLYGPLVVDDNQPGNIACVGDIVVDLNICVDLATSLPVCSFINADNGGGGGAFGNGIGDALDPVICSGATLVVSSGTVSEGQVTRVGQYDCAVTDPACSDQWDVGVFSTFVNGIEETEISGEKTLVIADNVSATFLILQQPIGIANCQDIDPQMDILWVNGSQGNNPFRSLGPLLGQENWTVKVQASATLSVGVQRPNTSIRGTSGRFVFHLNPGVPSSATVGTLFDLGDSCFPFIGGSPVVVENNIGKTNIVGASNYFGVPVTDPAKAPTFLQSLLQPVIDTANLPIGSQWTGQVIADNGAASSTKGASLSNGVIFDIE